MKSNKVYSIIEEKYDWESIINEAQDYKYIIILRDHDKANGAGDYCSTSIIETLYKTEAFWFFNIERPVHTVILTDVDVPSNIAYRQRLSKEIAIKTQERYKVYMPMRPACDGRATERTQPEAFAEWRKNRKDGQAKIDALTEVINDLTDRYHAAYPGFPSSLYQIER